MGSTAPKVRRSGIRRVSESRERPANEKGADPSTPFLTCSFASLRGLDLNQRPLGYETGDLMLSCVVWCRSVLSRPGSVPRSPARAAEVRVVRLQMVCSKATKSLSTLAGANGSRDEVGDLAQKLRS